MNRARLRQAAGGVVILALAACGSTASRPEGDAPLVDGWDAQGRYCVAGMGRQAEFAARTGVMLARVAPQDVLTGGWEDADTQRYRYRIAQLEGGRGMPEALLHTAVIDRAGERYTCAWEESQ